MISGGDWALDRFGAVFLQGTEGVTIEGCLFQQLDGNGALSLGTCDALYEHVQRCSCRDTTAMPPSSATSLRSLDATPSRSGASPTTRLSTWVDVC